MITNTILNFFRFLFLKIDKSSLHIKTLSQTLDFALLFEPVDNIPHFPTLKATVSTPFLLLLIMPRTVSLADSFAGFLAIAFFTALA